MSYEPNIYDPSDKIEIEETLRGQATGIICVDVCAVILFIVVSIATIIISEGSIIGIVIVIFIWIAMTGIGLWSYHYIRGSGKIRKFIITNDYISIQVPDNPPFTVNVSDFNTIETRRIITGYKYTKKAFYIFTFTGPNYSNSHQIQSQKDFSRKAIKKFRRELEDFSARKGLNYSFRKGRR
ncbi:MAG: hypothetical protein ACFFB0_02815 [Promethearchaeota archaeon]